VILLTTSRVVKHGLLARFACRGVSAAEECRICFYCHCPRHLGFQAAQPFQKTVRRLQGLGAPGFKFTAGDGVFVPEVFDSSNEAALFGVEVAIQFALSLEFVTAQALDQYDLQP